MLFWYWQMLSSIAHSGLNIFLYFSPLWTIDDDIRRDQKSTKAIPNFLLSKRKLFLFRHFRFLPLISSELSAAKVAPKSPTQEFTPTFALIFSSIDDRKKKYLHDFSEFLSSIHDKWHFFGHIFSFLNFYFVWWMASTRRRSCSWREHFNRIHSRVSFFFQMT